MLDQAGWHIQAYLSLCVCQSAGGVWNASSNLGRRWVADAVNLHGQFTRQLFVVADKQAGGYDQR